MVKQSDNPYSSPHGDSLPPSKAKHLPPKVTYALIGFMIGTLMLMPLVLTYSVIGQLIGGMIFGGPIGALVGYLIGRRKS